MFFFLFVFRLLLKIFVFLFIVCLLVTHAQTGFSVALIGVIAAFLTVLTALVTSEKGTAPGIIKGIDYKTLLFFVGLFIVVGGLEETDILKAIASFIDKMSGGNVYLMVAIVIWVSAIASAFIDKYSRYPAARRCSRYRCSVGVLNPPRPTPSASIQRSRWATKHTC